MLGQRRKSAFGIASSLTCNKEKHVDKGSGQDSHSGKRSGHAKEPVKKERSTKKRGRQKRTPGKDGRAPERGREKKATAKKTMQ